MLAIGICGSLVILIFFGHVAPWHKTTCIVHTNNTFLHHIARPYTNGTEEQWVLPVNIFEGTIVLQIWHFEQKWFYCSSGFLRQQILKWSTNKITQCKSPLKRQTVCIIIENLLFYLLLRWRQYNANKLKFWWQNVVESSLGNIIN